MDTPTDDPRRGARRTAWAGIAAALSFALVSAVDWMAPPTVPFGPYYLIPVAISAWYLGTAATALAVVAASVARTFVLSRLFPAGDVLLYAIDIATSLAVHTGVAVLLTRMRTAHRLLGEKTRALHLQARKIEERLRLEWSMRRAVASDVDAIVALTVVGAQTGDLSKDVLEDTRREAVRANYAASIQTGMATRRTWHGTQAQVPIEFWVSHVNGAVAGCFMVMGVDEQAGGGRELAAIVTATKFREAGVGSAMVDFFCAHYHGRRLYAACMPDGRMHRMLTRRGFGHFADTKEGYVIVARADWAAAPQDAQPKLSYLPVSDSVLEDVAA